MVRARININGRGSAVAVTQGNAYVGMAANGQGISARANETTGRYDFTLRKPLDHANTSDPDDVIKLSFGVRAEDRW